MKINGINFLDTSLEYNNVNKKIRSYKSKKLKLITKKSNLKITI